MSAPTYSAGPLNNIVNRVSLAAGGGANVAALLDLSTVFGGRVYCKLETGATPPTLPTTFGCFAAPAATAAAPNTTLAGAVSVGASTISVASAAGIAKGDRLALIPAGGLVGEVVTVQNISGTTLTLAANTINAYAVSDRVFFVEPTASGGSVAPGSSWSANSVYGTSIYPPEAFVWIIVATNTDTGQSVTVSMTTDKNPTIQ